MLGSFLPALCVTAPSAARPSLGSPAAPPRTIAAAARSACAHWCCSCSTRTPQNLAASHLVHADSMSAPLMECMHHEKSEASGSWCRMCAGRTAGAGTDLALVAAAGRPTQRRLRGRCSTLHMPAQSPCTPPWPSASAGRAALHTYGNVGNLFDITSFSKCIEQQCMAAERLVHWSMHVRGVANLPQLSSIRASQALSCARKVWLLISATLALASNSAPGLNCWVQHLQP